ncbi:MAG: hypothetical protein JWM75_1719 [Sphingomonas bacterium]|nr:hypothetical protein [Sphingomonas bacterium]
MKIAVPALAALLVLGGCGGQQSPAEQTAENLEAAADQSDPAAAEVLDNAADTVRDQGESGVPNNAAATAQEALEQAGNAQVAGNSQ